MSGFIERIQQKPLPVRRRITFWTAFFVTLLIALVWLTTTVLTAGTPKTSPTAQAPGPLSTLFENVGDGLSALKNSLPF